MPPPFVLPATAERNYQLYTNAHMDIVTAVKEALGYVAIDYEAELADADTGAIPDLEQEYELPDGQVGVGHVPLFGVCDVRLDSRGFGRTVWTSPQQQAQLHATCHHVELPSHPPPTLPSLRDPR